MTRESVETENNDHKGDAFNQIIGENKKFQVKIRCKNYKTAPLQLSVTKLIKYESI